MEKNKFFGINGLRAISMFIIVLFHVIDRFSFASAVKCGEKVEIFTSSFVSLFMMISAFSLCCGYYTKIKNNEITLNDFYRKRYLRILPLFSCIVILDIIFSGLTKNNIFEGFANVTLLFGFLPKKISIVGVGWTIGVIFAFYLLFPFFVFVSWNKKRVWVFFVISIIFKMVVFDFFQINIESIEHSFIVWIPYFILGIIIFLYKDQLIKYLVKYKKYIYILSLIFLTIKYMFSSIDNKNIYDIVRLSSDGLLIISAIIAPNKILDNKVTKYASDISFEVYMVHMIFINALFKLKITNIISNYYINIVVIFMVVFLLSFLSSIVINHIDKKIKKYLKLN